MRTVAIPIAAFAVAGLALAVACGGSTATSATPAADAGDVDAELEGGACDVGSSRMCAMCPAGATGTQTCTSTGWSACFCELADAQYDGPEVCGDGICSGGENCETCPVDCGQCVACSLAPSCSNGASLPATFSPLSDLDCTDTDGGNPSCGVGIDAGPPIQDTDCLAPLLKIGLADVTVVLNGVSGSLNMFCIIGADDGHTSELIITPQLSGIPDHSTPILVPASEGTFWGQSTGTPLLSQFPITINYQCFEVDSNSTWEAVLGAIAKAAGALAQVPDDPYGWAFGIASAAASAAQAGLQASDGASMRLDYQQTIDPSSFLEMTNGKTWTVEQSGNTNGYNWDWILDMQSWGCSASRDAGTSP
jgi:hypothetical protein